jgi:hypothetical protein
MRAETTKERCAHCKLDVAAWRIRKHGRVYCSSYCAGQGKREPVEVVARRPAGARA